MERVKSFLFYVFISFAAFALLFILSLMFYHFYQMYTLVPRDNVKETVGTVLGYEKTRKGELAKVYFQHDEKVYLTKISDDYVYCEKFMVEYEQDNLKANRVRLDKPVFLKGEDTSLTVGYLETYNPNYFKVISYTYYVNGVKYVKYYEPLENSELKYPNVKEGYNYMVKYWDFDPQRSIILLDNKTNKSLYDN